VAGGIGMDLNEFKAYCMQKEGVSEEYPFDRLDRLRSDQSGPVTMVMKVNKKMFALMQTHVTPLRINLKCDPELAVFLRSQYPAIIPGWHMNKVHWNTVVLDGSVPDSEIREMIDHSYDLVTGKRKKAKSS
jgi:predicted DNA-binding protein (MmcQ/YjbR family)